MTDRARPGLVALHDIRPGNRAGPFLQPGARTGLKHQQGKAPVSSSKCFCYL